MDATFPHLYVSMVYQLTRSARWNMIAGIENKER